MLGLVVAVLATVAAALLCRWRGIHVVVNLLIALGMFQAVAVTLVQDSALSVADDATAGVLILWAVGHALRRPSTGRTASLVVLGLCGALAVVALIRSPDPTVGVVQARQVAVPVGLVFAGSVLRDRIQWVPVLRWTVGLTLAAAAYALGEWVVGGPLLDPTYYYLEHASAAGRLRDGLPVSYVADTPSGAIVRSGGPFLNPPSLGFFLASGVVASLLLGYLLPLAVLAAGLAVAFARAGIVISGMASVVAWTWERFGKWISLTLALAAGGALTLLFLRQGNTASHAQGLVTGVQYALEHPFGEGFGNTGYQAALAPGDLHHDLGSESLIGLYAVWLGLPALLLFAGVLVRLLVTLSRQRLSASQSWAAIAVLVAAAVSETASSLSATALLWLICGATLGGHDLRDQQAGGSRWKDLSWVRRALAGVRRGSSVRSIGRPGDPAAHEKGS